MNTNNVLTNSPWQPGKGSPSRERIRRFVASVTGFSDSALKDSVRLADLALGSLDTVELLIELEDEFRIHISQEDLVAANTIGQLISLFVGESGFTQTGESR